MASLKNISIEVLRQLLRYDPETGKIFWKYRSEEFFTDGVQSAKHNAAKWNNKYANAEALTFLSKGYLTGSILRKYALAHRVSYALYHGEWPNNIDHINHNKSDNRIKNLRSVTKAENSKNLGMNKGNASGFNGVSWDKSKSRWAVKIHANGKRINLGYYIDLNAAIAAREDANMKYNFHPNNGCAA